MRNLGPPEDTGYWEMWKTLEEHQRGSLFYEWKKKRKIRRTKSVKEWLSMRLWEWYDHNYENYLEELCNQAVDWKVDDEAIH